MAQARTQAATAANSKEDEGAKSLPAVYDYGEYADAGFENQTKDDYSIPFLEVLQGLSPELETLEGARPGHILNKVTQDIFAGKDGIVFVPCYTQHVFVEWIPRDSGGGLVAVHDINSPVVEQARSGGQRTGRLSLENGNELVETFYVFGIQVLPDGSSMSCVMAFSSTKIKKYKSWMTKARTIQIVLPGGRKINPPLFAHRYRLTTSKEKNKHGEFYNWEVSFDGETAEAARLSPHDQLFKEAANVLDMVKSGKAKADYSSQAAEANAAGDGTEGEMPTDSSGRPAF